MREVARAHNGRSAFALAKAKRPDLVLCDLRLPGDIDGFAMVRAARADEQLQKTRFVAVSGYSQPNDYAQAGRAGFEQLVPQPITLEIIEKLINDKLS